MNPVNPLTFYLFKIHFKIIHLHIGFPGGSLPFRFCVWNSVYISDPLHVCYIFCPSYPHPIILQWFLLHWKVSRITACSIFVIVLFSFKQIVIPRGPIKAKGLLLACIQDKDPCIFFEPKVLYRAAVEDVPVKDYTLPLGKADVLVTGKERHVTIWVWNFVLLSGKRIEIVWDQSTEENIWTEERSNRRMEEIKWWGAS